MSSPNKSKFVCLPKSFEEELTCAICLNLFNNPLTTPCCRNTYCGQCIIKCLVLNGSTCPTCRCKICAKRLVNVPRFVSNILNKLEVYCDYKPNGCQKVMTNEEMDKHLIECPFDPKKISNTKYDLPKSTKPEFVMFGTYQTKVDSVFIEFITEGIKLMAVFANNYDIRQRYHITIPFIEMIELLYCCGDTNLLFIKPTLSSNLKITECLCLGDESINGLKFNINSVDPRQRYIIIVLKETMNQTFIGTLRRTSTHMNPRLAFNPIDSILATLLLEQTNTKLTPIPSLLS